jgi:hypothetical protein
MQWSGTNRGGSPEVALGFKGAGLGNMITGKRFLNLCFFAEGYEGMGTGLSPVDLLAARAGSGAPAFP